MMRLNIWNWLVIGVIAVIAVAIYNGYIAGRKVPVLDKTLGKV